jgi:hypothetical protein
MADGGGQVSRSLDRCAFEDCERPVKPGAQICAKCADGAEPSEDATTGQVGYDVALTFHGVISGCPKIGVLKP